jgi:GT2 family glycosyltransferase
MCAAHREMVSVSIVSHRHGALLRELLRDLERCPRIEVLLTLNVEEPLAFDPHGFGFPLALVRNARPRGFGANHNAAFARAAGDCFCVLNPDVRFDTDPFPRLRAVLQDPAVGCAAPLVLSPAGAVEDSARRFPTPARLLARALARGARPEYETGTGAFSPDWVAGMFMMFRSDVFRAIGGFDERYFLYYEDADLCARLRAAGYDVRLDPAVRVVHAARRASRRNLRHLGWHVASALRFFATHGVLRR